MKYGGFTLKIVIQRVSRAAVTVDGRTAGAIGRGYVVLFGAGIGDDKCTVEKTADKIQRLRLFPDENGKTNLSLQDVNGDLLIISQFTLYADCKKGNRPGFTGAAPPLLAEELYEHFIAYARERFSKVEHGVFGASMQVELVNDGPFTVILEE
jgi:D-tyrosyl-tRNA(Tyr) deacylase